MTDPAAAILHLLTGAALSSWLIVRVAHRRPLDVMDHALAVALTLFGPLVVLAVAYDIATHGLVARR